MLTLNIERDGKAITYEAEYIKCGRQIDMGLEIGEMIGPVLGVMAAAQGIDMDSAAIQAVTQNVGQSLAQVAQRVLKAGGAEYIIRLCEEAHVIRRPQGGDGVKLTRANYNLVLSGKGASAELVKVARWLIQENFSDFFSELLASYGLKAQGQE